MLASLARQLARKHAGKRGAEEVLVSPRCGHRVAVGRPPSATPPPGGLRAAQVESAELAWEHAGPPAAAAVVLNLKGWLTTTLGERPLGGSQSP